MINGLLKRRLTLEERKAWKGALFLLPWVVGFFLFVAYPMFFSFRISFGKVNPAGFTMRFIGLKNYTRAFIVDIEFLPKLWDTAKNVIIDTPIILVFSLSVAVLLARKMKGQTLLRALFFLPVVISSGYVIQELFDQGVGGLAVSLGIEGGADSATTMYEIGATTGPQAPNIINVTSILKDYLGPDIAQGIDQFLNRLGLTLWHSGIQIILFLGGLHQIPDSLYESGRIDGANEWTLFWKVTLPMLSPIILAGVIYTIVDSSTDIFNQVLHYISDLAFRTAIPDFGYSAALAWIYFMVIFAMLLIVQLTMGRRVFYRGAK